MTVGGNAAVDAWFVDHVLPLEMSITHVIRRSTRGSADIGDIRQEVYLKIYEAALKAIPANPRAFTFTVCRNLLIDRARRAQIVPIETRAKWEDFDVPADLVPVDRQAIDRQELERLRRTLQLLPPRCREVILLRRIEGLSQRQTAERMGITEDTVERQMSKGIRRLADLMAEGEQAITDDGPRLGFAGHRS